MATSYTSLLGFALPVTGELDGTWGDTVNNSITQLVEDSVAGVATTSVAGGDWTLTTTGSGAANQARCAIIIPTGSPGVSRNIIAPSKSKAYVVVNQSDAAVVFKGAATTGVTISTGNKVLVAWNGSDFVQIGVSVGGSNTQVQYNSSGALAGSSNLTFDGTKLTAAGIKNSALTTGRVTYATTSGELTDSTNLTFDGTKLTAAGIKDSALTTGRVTYATTSGELTDSANLTFNGTTLTANQVSSTQVDITAQGDLRLQDTAGGEYVAIQAPGVLAASYTLTMPTTDGDANQVLTTDGSGVLSWTTPASSGGGFTAVSVISGNTNATNKYLYVMTASLTLTLPGSPSAGDYVGVQNSSATTTCVIGRNGSNIMSSATDMTVDVVDAGFTLYYADATRGWVIL